MTSQPCLFCKLARKEGDASIVYEDNKTIAFLDIRPASEGHTLVIPKAHYESIFDIPDDELTNLYKSVKKTASAVKKAVNAEGISIGQQNGHAAGQRIFHIHVHIIPRYEGHKIRPPEELNEAKREKLNEIAVKIRKAY